KAIDILLERQLTFEMGSRRKATLDDLLGNLYQFGRFQFHFFYDGLGERRAIDLLDIDPNDPTIPLPHFVTGYPITEHILRVIINQVTDDLSVIQRAAEQRQISGTAAGEAASASQENIFFALGETDRMALSVIRALATYIPNAENTTAITYFYKSANVRVIPYMPVALIGVPMTLVGINGHEVGVHDDLLAIPHEFGHYLYWNGEIAGERFYKRLARVAVDPLVHLWLEEIVADVVGCLVGGAAATFSFMELLLGTIGNRFITTTDVHPTPALRPYLYFRVLEAMNQGAIAAKLRGWWEGKLSERAIFPSRPHLYAAYKLVDEILTLIPPDTIDAQWQWSSATELSDISGDFRAQKERILQAIPIEDLDPPTRPRPADWHALASQLTTTEGQDSVVDTLDPSWIATANSHNPGAAAVPQIAAKDWLRIFESSGWTTGEPHGREP
ncbi:MAG: hypothetical protein KDE31_20225, partial [Caldilineaceae bacterium]|nr:hypothetical protein [Caldilineaceae bacterium]